MYMNNRYFENSPTVFFKWCNKSGWLIEYASGNVAGVFGYSKKDFVSQSIRYDHVIHPYDLSRVNDEIIKASRMLSDEFAHEPYRIITQNGEIRWVEDTTKIKRSNDGIIVAYHGCITDITQQVNVS